MAGAQRLGHSQAREFPSTDAGSPRRAAGWTERHDRLALRVGAVKAAVGAAVVVWAVAHGAAGIDVRAPAFDGSATGVELGLPAIVGTAAVASLIAWGLLAALERFTRHARRTWTALVVAGFVASLSGPLSGTGIDGEQRLLLVGFHAAVAGVLVPLMRRSARATRTEAPSKVEAVEEV